MSNLLHARCQAEGVPAMSDAEIRHHRAEVSGWQVNVLVPKESIESAAWAGARPIVLGVMAALTIAAFLVWLSGWRSDRRKE